MTTGPRILYVPNEDHDFRQIGFRRPLANLLDAGLVEAVSIFSLQWRQRQGGDAEQHRQDLITRIKDFRPNVILMQHLNKTGLSNRHFKVMRDAADFDFIYHEADPYSRFLHPLPDSARAAARFSDVAFTVGSGVFKRNLERAGARDVRWAPSAYTSERYLHYEPDATTRKYDVVVVANRNMPRFKGHPNWKERIAFVNHLQDRIGDRLAVYGKGWSGAGAMGSVPVESQDHAVRSGWISANWDHYAKEPNYFSNRLPISLAAGSIHATTRHPGYERLFPKEVTGSFLIYERTYIRLARAIERMLANTDPEQRLRACALGQEFVGRQYKQDDQFIDFLNYKSVRVNKLAAKASWDVSVSPLAQM